MTLADRTDPTGARAAGRREGPELGGRRQPARLGAHLRASGHKGRLQRAQQDLTGDIDQVVGHVVEAQGPGAQQPSDEQAVEVIECPVDPIGHEHRLSTRLPQGSIHGMALRQEGNAAEISRMFLWCRALQ